MSGPTCSSAARRVIPEVLGDVPLTPPEGQGVLGVSDNRGLADEEVTFVVPEDADGWVNIQITSFDGAYSNEPWMLRVEESPAIELPPGCKLPLALGGGTTRALPASVGGNTLYLFNSKRYGDLYGNANETALWNKLQTLAARVRRSRRHGHPGRCDPGNGRDSRRLAGRPLLTGPEQRRRPSTRDVPRHDHGALQVHRDRRRLDLLPAGLVLDNTLYANERDYASTFFGVENTQYLSSYALGYLPTDDPYGDTSYSGQGAYIPEVAVGRLVESHGEIMGQLDQYLTRNGAIDPATALVTGYDFLSDGANAVSNGLTGERRGADSS